MPLAPGWTPNVKDALGFVADEHALLLGLLRDFQRGFPYDGDRGAARLEEIRTALQIHAQVEEELFYPAAQEALAGSQAVRLLADAGVAHATMAGLIERLELISPADPGYEETFDYLAQAVRRHLAEEERVLFPAMRRSRIELGRLGARMAVRRIALAVELGVATPGDTDEAEEAEEAEQVR